MSPQALPAGGPPLQAAETAPATRRAPLRVDESLVSVEALKRHLASPGAPTVVDVRSKAAYAASHIPGAIHRRLYQLKVSAALRAGPAVLVGAGHGGGGMGPVLKALRAGGLDVRALDGGMQAWCRAGGDVRGVGGCTGVDGISPREIHVGARCPDRAILRPASSSGTWTAPAEAVRAAQQLVSERPIRMLAIMDADGSSYDQLREPLRAALDVHIFFVDGGLAAYRVFEEQRRAMQKRRRLVSVPEGRGVVRAQKGCGCL